LINCPSCGSNFEGDLCLGCPSCGARSVGPPLAQAEHELPSYGRAVMVAGSGLAVSGVFVASMIAALIEFGAFPPRFGSIMAAGQVASWRLKWVMIPVAIIVLWGGARIIRSIKATPGKFIGLRAARMGFAASVLVTVMIGTLIGVTIPERLRQRDLSIEAKWTARAYTFHRAQLEYRELHGTLPTEVKDLRTLPDSDGSIADALNFIDPNGYQAGSVLAAASTKSKPLVSRGSAIRNAAPGANATADHAGVSFTSYDLRLPGEDKILNTDDDFIVHDGVVTKVSDLPAGARPPNAP
jgi:type II secretory pathway pseudopilin PulG